MEETAAAAITSITTTTTTNLACTRHTIRRRRHDGIPEATIVSNALAADAHADNVTAARQSLDKRPIEADMIRPEVCVVGDGHRAIGVAVAARQQAQQLGQDTPAQTRLAGAGPAGAAAASGPDADGVPALDNQREQRPVQVFDHQAAHGAVIVEAAVHRQLH